MRKTFLIGIVIIALLLTILNVHVIAKGARNIEQRTLNRLDKTDGVTSNINNVLGDSYQEWDKELNRVYRSLMKKLKPEGKKALKKTQIKWIKYKEEKEKNIWIIFRAGAGCGGTMDSMSVNSISLETIKQRTLELTELLRMTKENTF